MKLSLLFRSLIATSLFALLGACTVVPAGHVGYRSGPAYVESYPAYRSPPGPSTYYYYESGRPRGGYGRHDDDRGYERRYDDRQERSAPLPPPLQLHRDIRRSLGLPRLPGMP